MARPCAGVVECVRRQVPQVWARSWSPEPFRAGTPRRRVPGFCRVHRVDDRESWGRAVAMQRQSGPDSKPKRYSDRGDVSPPGPGNHGGAGLSIWPGAG